MTRLKLVSVFLLSCFTAVGAYLPNSRPISLAADLTDAPRKLLHAELKFPVEPGPLALCFPKWIPGEHAPSGPIENLAGLMFTAKGERLAWKRDDVDMYTVRLDVPAGVTEVIAKIDFLATAAPAGFSAGASTSANLAVLNWNELVLYPSGARSSDVVFAPSVKVPEGWKLGTALRTSSTEHNLTHFEPVPLNMLIDSPLLAGRFFKEIPLAPEINPRHFLDLAADNPEDLNVNSQQIDSFSNLVRETGSLFKSRHYTSYHFLLTLSDQVAHFGLEHHQSSDDRVEARDLIDDDLSMLNGDLLPHEFTHSWNGKYRRPAGLVTDNFQQPMKGELLWVYEGLTQYLGDVLAVRSGIWTAEQYRSYLASSAAEMDHRPGRTWRSLEDTAVSAQALYSTSDEWDNWRRSTDFYQEAELLWLEVDTNIRKLSRGKKSLNDFCASFYGPRGNGEPITVPYNLDDLVSALNTTEPFDWVAFFRKRLASNEPGAPLDGLKQGGYRLEYSDQANEFIRATEGRDRGVRAWYSLGINTTSDNAINDVLVGSLAYQAGLGPGMKLLAVDGRRASEEVLRQAIQGSKKSKEPLELIIDNDGYVKVLKIDYHDGEKYPRLVRTSEQHSYLDDIVKPLAQHINQASLQGPSDLVLVGPAGSSDH